ncbi:hypothetical protein D3C87_1406780 [compost metagenome]
MPVSGACIMALKDAAMPATIKLATFKCAMPRVLIVNASAKPIKPPIIKLGAKIPPFPPAPSVINVAADLAKTVTTVNRIITQGRLLKSAKMLLLSIEV